MLKTNFESADGLGISNGGWDETPSASSTFKEVCFEIYTILTKALFFSISQSYLDPRNSSSLGNCFLLAELGPPFSPSFGVWIAGLALDNIIFKTVKSDLSLGTIFWNTK